MALQEHLSTLLTSYTDAQVVLFGLEREGLSTYHFLRAYLPETELILSDDKTTEHLSNTVQQLLAEDHSCRFVHSEELTTVLSPTRDVILYKSAGIPHTHPVLENLRSHHQLIITSNTEQFFQVLNELPLDQQPLTIGVTGTKGKSTTTSLIFTVCQHTGRSCFLVGNIGEPPLNCLAPLAQLPQAELVSSIVVLELSSHQLQYLHLSPKIAVLQNITPEHLDYYPDFASYRDAKANITLHQTASDLLICNPRFAEPRAIAAQSLAQKKYFALEPSTEFALTACVQENTIYYQDEAVMAIADIPLRGIHNVLNTIPAVMIGKELGLETEAIQAAVRSFQALPHRLQFVAQKNGVEYYNDSQGTTPEASIAALESFADKPVILIAGGSDKGADFTELAEQIASQNIGAVFLFPPTGEGIAQKIREQLSSGQSSFAIEHVTSMQQAVARAAALAKPGSVVLLSPACASFGLFKNYQDRGNQFITAVAELSD